MQGLLKSNLVHMAVGFLLMGGWALFANRSHGLSAAWAPALVQGLLSAILTGLIKRALEAMSGRTPAGLAFILPPLVTATSVLTVLVLAHLAVGTPELLATIAVPWSVSTTYAFIYNAALVRGARQQGLPPEGP